MLRLRSDTTDAGRLLPPSLVTVEALNRLVNGMRRRCCAAQRQSPANNGCVVGTWALANACSARSATRGGEYGGDTGGRGGGDAVVAGAAFQLALPLAARAGDNLSDRCQA